MGVVSPEYQCKIKNHEIVFYRTGRQLCNRKFPTIQYKYIRQLIQLMVCTACDESFFNIGQNCNLTLIWSLTKWKFLAWASVSFLLVRSCSTRYLSSSITLFTSRSGNISLYLVMDSEHLEWLENLEVTLELIWKLKQLLSITCHVQLLQKVEYCKDHGCFTAYEMLATRHTHRIIWGATCIKTLKTTILVYLSLIYKYVTELDKYPPDLYKHYMGQI